jgi:hypothetical protein
MTVPAGFTTHVFDRVVDPSDPNGRLLVGPVPAKLPVGIDILALPFGEPTIIKIASPMKQKRSTVTLRLTQPNILVYCFTHTCEAYAERGGSVATHCHRIMKARL